MNKYLKTIKKIAIIGGLVAASYFVGLNQHLPFQELPKKVQQAVVDEHHTLDSLLTQAVDQYKKGNPQKALELYRQVEQGAESLEKINPEYEKLEAKIFRYGAAIIDTVETVQEINSIYENIVAGTPERINQYVSGFYHIGGTYQTLETIKPGSGAYHRLDGDKEAQKSLLRYYVSSSRRWYDALEQMREKLQNTENKTRVMEKALESLDERMGDINRNRQWLDKFEKEHKLK